MPNGFPLTKNGELPIHVREHSERTIRHRNFNLRFFERSCSLTHAQKNRLKIGHHSEEKSKKTKAVKSAKLLIVN
jgi:hypothetical protein